MPQGTSPKDFPRPLAAHVHILPDCDTVGWYSEGGMKVEIWSGSNVGLVRKSNEDFIGCFPEMGLFIVADGMGGHATGEVASQMAVDLIHESLENEFSAQSKSNALVALTRRVFDRGVSAGPDRTESLLEAAVTLANRR